MGSGDEVTLAFPCGGHPSAGIGITRDFLLKVDGWAKDSDPNTAFSSSVQPLPFHAMSQYPYPASNTSHATPCTISISALTTHGPRG